MIGAKTADRTRRYTYHSPGLSIPNAMSIGARAYIERVFQHARNGSIVFRRNEQNRVRRLDLLAKLHPRRRWSIVVVLVIEGKLSNLDNFQLKLRGASAARALAVMRLNEPLRRLPTNTATFRVVLMARSPWSILTSGSMGPAAWTSHRQIASTPFRSCATTERRTLEFRD
jgi:hypothetical protein